jgi:hypothetical protein
MINDSLLAGTSGETRGREVLDWSNARLPVCVDDLRENMAKFAKRTANPKTTSRRSSACDREITFFRIRTVWWDILLAREGEREGARSER